MRLSLRTKVLTGLLIAVGLTSFGLFHPTHATALSGSDFNAGNIIDDGIFYNSDSMGTSDIQAFLNAKVPTCDTNGTQNSTHYNSGAGRYYTRAEWGSLNGNPAPYTCLRNYTQDTPTKAADAYCAGTYTGGNKNAAQIINDVSHACGVSPKVFLVLLQKEQSLITDDWPWPVQYRSATGYGCPDTAACDSAYYGFFNQVYNAARQYQRYAKQSNLFNYRPAQTSYIQYNPNSGCGGSNVYIHNYATAGLYNYTPYQPNAAALANLYGTGDSCSAYGNRNFWRMFNDWFGLDSSGIIQNGVVMHTIVSPDASPFRGQYLEYTFTLTNNLSVDLPINAVGVVGKLGDPVNGANRDFGWWGPVTLHSGETLQFTFNTTVRDVGNIYVWPALNYQGTYVHYNNWGVRMQAHYPKLTLTTPLSSSDNSPVAGQTFTLTTVVRNDEDVPMSIDTIGIPVRFMGAYNYDTAWANSSSTLSPGQSKTVSGSLTTDKAGSYTTWVSALVGGMYNTLSPIINFNVPNPTPNFSLTYLETPNPAPAMGEDVAVKFKLKNNLGVPVTLNAVGVVGRYDNPYSGTNRDFGWVGPITFAANEEKSFTGFTSNVSQLKDFYAWVAINYKGSYIHYNNWGFMMKPHVPNISFTSPLTVNGGTTPTLGQSANVAATIKNNETKPIKFTALGIAARYYGVYNYDATWQTNGTLAASGQSGDSVSLAGNVTFDKRGPYTVWTSLNVGGTYMTLGSVKNLNL